MIHQLPYGIKNGKLVSIHEVESGLKCECTCPACGGQLVARKGSVKAYHFAHHHEGNCKGALETALHLAAKEILEEYKKIVLPILLEYDEKYTEKIIILAEPYEVILNEVRLEQAQKGFKPDVIGLVGKTEIFIEVAVTHFVDAEKIKKVQQKGVSMIEIDLSYLDDGFTREELIQEVIYSEDNKFWVYNAKQELLFEKKMAPIIENHNRIAEEKKLLEAKLEKERTERESQEIHEQVEFLKRHEIIQREKQVAESEGDKVHNIGDHICSHLMTKTAKRYPDNNFTSQLKNGTFWNGLFYGNRRNGKYVFIGGEKKYIFLPEGDFYDLKNEFENELYGQLNGIARGSIINKEKCSSCENFVSFIDKEKTHVVCRLKKNTK